MSIPRAWGRKKRLNKSASPTHVVYASMERNGMNIESHPFEKEGEVPSQTGEGRINIGYEDGLAS
jgi:hypothetical protein